MTTAKRSSVLPDMPTIAEAGVPGYELSPWFAVYMPAGTPQPIIDKINAALLQSMKAPEVSYQAAARASPFGRGQSPAALTVT